MWEDGSVEIDGRTYYYEAKVYDLPSKYGIFKGRVSKLYVTPYEDDDFEINYDRGWITPGIRKNEKYRRIVEAIVAKYPNPGKK